MTVSSHAVDNIDKCYNTFSALLVSVTYLYSSTENCLNTRYLIEKRILPNKSMQPLVKKYPKLPMVVEHISTKEAVEFVFNSDPYIAATITPQHLAYDMSKLLHTNIHTHYFCMPILKTPEDKDSIRMAAISGNKKFFAGTGSAPHAISSTESSVVAAGCYSAYNSLELYTEIFEKLDALDKLENFTSYFGSVFYKEPPSKNKVTLIKASWQMPKTLPFGTEAVVATAAGETL